MKKLTNRAFTISFALLLIASLFSSFYMSYYFFQEMDSSEDIISIAPVKTFPNIRSSSITDSNVSIISDGYNNEWGWNTDDSKDPEIAIDGGNTLHVVWEDNTDGIWGTDVEIMYANYTDADGWSNATVISDGFNNIWDWNNDSSLNPDIAIDGANNLHVVWQDNTDGIWGDDSEIMYANYTEADGWSNATVISDGYDNIWGWNTGDSSNPEIIVDGANNIHVVWEDETDGIWKDNSLDSEIMYANYTVVTDQWSNATVISDGFNNIWGWNTGESSNSEIIIDRANSLHVVWQDKSDGIWKDNSLDSEIMYANYTEGKGWSNATVISDGFNNIWGWNTGSSFNPDITVDGANNLHVVWDDNTDGIWKDNIFDYEIMYVNYIKAIGQWSNATVISDGYNGKYWNIQGSYYPEIAIDGINNIHVVWQDSTEGVWGDDNEIMYVNFTEGVEWSNATVISDGYDDIWEWNTGVSSNSKIAIDGANNLHIVWQDNTEGIWGSDEEIMYSKVTFFDQFVEKFENSSVISDGYNDIWGWNTDSSENPEIAVDGANVIHVVWQDITDGIWRSNSEDYEIMYANYTEGVGWSNATVISDGYNNEYWNSEGSYNPDIAVDGSNNLHVVWQDITDGIWRSNSGDYEIMYVNYTEGVGWSNATVISDGYNNEYWNSGGSYNPDIAIDGSNNLHVVWKDNTDGIWGDDPEIMYVNYSVANGQWSNATVISDGYNDIWGWNMGISWDPDIVIDSMNNIHVVWHDYTNGIWGGSSSDSEIMYVNYSVATGQWSNASVISDGYNGKYWNTGRSTYTSIAIDGSNNIHVVWEDQTNGIWGGGSSDSEIMYVNYSVATGQWSNASVISDGFNNEYWNIDSSYRPDLAIDGLNNIHVVWYDYTNGIWDSDSEIMYVIYSVATVQWSNVTVISDGYNDIWGWNMGNSGNPEITVDGSNNIHIVWEDDTDGVWGSDKEVMYMRGKYTPIKPPDFRQPTNGGSNGDDSSVKKPLELNIILIMIIILIAIVVVILSGVVYSIKSKKKKNYHGISKGKLAKSLNIPNISKDFKPKKKFKKGTSISTHVPLSEKDKEELKKTEAEVDVEKIKVLCIVHKGEIKGSSYVCPKCNAFYCIRCAEALKDKVEKCWVCGSDIHL